MVTVIEGDFRVCAGVKRVAEQIAVSQIKGCSDQV